MKVINYVIKDYLKEDKVDYAILIDGTWGSGKTYYWKNYLEKIITNEDITPIYISLNGVSSIKEIGKKIFLIKSNIIEYEENKKSELLNLAFNFARNKLGINDENNFNIDNFINMENTLLCFDDLERCNIEIDKVLGYINNFVEHDGVKTIIIGHEKEIKNNFVRQNIELKVISTIIKEENDFDISKINDKILKIYNNYSYYDKIKEKLIGITLNFNPTKEYYEMVLNNIIDQYNNEKYNEFIGKNKELILKIFFKGGQNIRTLRYGIKKFEKIFNILIKNDRKKILNVIRNLFIYTLAISFEWKINNKLAIELKKVTEENYMTAQIFGVSENSNNNKKESKSYIDEFFEKYYDGTTYEFIHSDTIVDYITTGYCNEEKFKRFIKEKIKSKEVTPFALLQRYWELEDNEYNEVVEKVLYNVKTGIYSVLLYPRIFAYFIRLSEKDLIKHDINDLRDLFLKGIKKAKNKSEYKELLLNDVGVYEEDNLPEEYFEIKEKALETNNELKGEIDKEKVNHLTNLITKNPVEFIEEYKNYIDVDRTFMFFNYINLDEFCDNLIKLENKYLVEFNKITKYRYDVPNVKEYFSGEYDNINLFLKKIKKYIKENDKEQSIKIYFLNELVNLLELVSSKLK